MKKPRIDQAVTNCILLGGLVLLIVLNFNAVVNCIGYVLGIFYPFFLGCIFAFLINIPMNFFETKVFSSRKSGKHTIPKKLRRPLALIVTLLIVVVVIWLIIIYLIPMLNSALATLSKTLTDAIPVWGEWIQVNLSSFPNVLAWFNEHFPKEIQVDKLLTAGINFLLNGALSSTNVVKIISDVAGAALNIIIAIVTAFYLCVSKERSWGWLTKMVYAILPKRGADETIHFGKMAFDIFHHFITGQCLEAILLTGLVAVVLSVMRFPYALLIAVVCGICCFIPMFGAYIAGALGAIMILSASPEKVILFIVVFLCIRLFDDNFMYPHVMGKSIGLPPVLVLLAITVGGALFGLLGMLAMIPIMSIIQKIVLRLVDLGLEKKGLAVVEQGDKVQVYDKPAPEEEEEDEDADAEEE